MVKAIDREIAIAKMKHEKSLIDTFTGAGTGLAISCLFSPGSWRRTAVIIVGLIMLGIGMYKRAKFYEMVFQYMNECGNN